MDSLIFLGDNNSKAFKNCQVIRLESPPLKMCSNKTNKMLIIYVRPKILKIKKDICLKRPLKIKASVRINLRVPNSLACKPKKKMLSLT